MKLLIVDNNLLPEYWGASDLVGSVRSSGHVIEVRRGPQDDLPRTLAGYGGVLLSGSLTPAMEKAPWVSSLDRLILSAIEKGLPLMGVCFGHQSISRAVAGYGTVRRSATPEYGWTRIRQTKESSWMKGLPQEFFSYSSHQDEVHSLPSEFEILASSAGCAVQAFQLRGKPVFGIQFHPEKTLESGEASIRKRIQEKKPVLTEGKGPKVFSSNVGEKLFANFLEKMKE